MKWVLAGMALMVFGSLVYSQGPKLSKQDEDFFEKKIRPLLVTHCYSCHSGEAKKLRADLRLDSREGLLKGGESGPVVAADPDHSSLIKAVRYTDPNMQMPPKGKLRASEVALLEEWVRRGAPFPDSGKAVVKNQSSINIAEGRKFWSFQPLKSHPAPKTQKQNWVQRPIDAFILAALEQQGLAPAAPTSRQTLIRRLTFDLIGLPPTPEEVEAFVQDDSPDAYEKLVERLLASPHHGERWGRYWLDLVRYCDEAESWAECEGDAYRYRDWVVQAFNNDMPFPEFVTKQLAVDLLPGYKPADLPALGFLGLSPSYWKELMLAPEVIEEVVAEEWEERIHTVSSTFLGLTVACARCHDHKFDPITTRDYYALAGIFASTRLVDRPLVPDDEKDAVNKARNKVKQIQKEIAKLLQSQVGSAKDKAEALQKQFEELKQKTPNLDAPVVPGVEDASLFVEPNGQHATKLVYKDGQTRDVAVQVRGSPAKLGPVVPRQFLEVLSPAAPKPFTQGSGRLELAQAIVTDAAPLTARVIVNRVWKHHFGKGLVETPSDFGTQGERPSHPELLDDLAFRFVQNGWSLKWLHREIVLSATYQQTSIVKTPGKGHTLDPDNRLLWRMNPQRLDVEAWRDAMLAVTGTLNRKIGGKSLNLDDVNNERRTLYGTIKRRELSDILRLYDFPNPVTHSAQRVPTTTPLQQLFTLNSPFMLVQAEALAERLKKEVPNGVEDRIQRAYLLLYGRAATEKEVRLGVAFLTSGAENGKVPPGFWEQYAQVLLGSNEFLFVD
jgi:hypothetical protein